MFAPFYERHREVAERETAVLKITPDHPRLPVDEYWFVECYCVDPTCDCRRVRVVVSPLSNPAKSMAVITWGWEPRAFYRKWMDDEDHARQTTEGDLEPMMPQSRHAGEFLRIFRERLVEDPQLGQQFSEHYALFKRGLAGEVVAAQAGTGTTRQQRRAALRALRKRGGHSLANRL